MNIKVRFFVYDDSNRQTSHRLQADVLASSLEGFGYGETLILQERMEGSPVETYVVAGQPIRQWDSYVNLDPRQTVDIYLALQKQWPEFKPIRSSREHTFSRPPQ
ncbi:hypothetical protein [Larkinella soli]|uniref:hypothetical protein n=1 Tax=Larkinella soli TaxID=1770527 RepID=UPI000FFC599E|nr:hypothetical protein [Larkinella soli]